MAVPRPRILLVDDESDVLFSLRTYLESAMDAEVAIALSGQEALAVLKKEEVDLIVSDFRMQGMDGLHFLRRAHEMREEVPRILLTAYADLQLVVEALNKAAISRVISKPVKPDVLATTLRDVLAISLRQRQREQALKRSADVAGTRGGETKTP